MVSMVRPRDAEVSDDLFVVDSPSLRAHPGEAELSDRRLLLDRPSFARRLSRALVRYLAVFGIGVGATLAWQSYGDEAKHSMAAWAAQHGWPTAWLGDAEMPTSGSPTGSNLAKAAPGAPTSSEVASSPPAASSRELEQLKTMTLGLAANLTTLRERLEQLASAQQQSVGEITKLQAAEQDIRHKISASAPRPAAAPASKSATTAPPPRAPAPPPAPR